MSLDTKKAQMRIMKLIEQVQLSDLINITDIGPASINETPVYSDLVMGGYGHLFALMATVGRFQRFGSYMETIPLFLIISWRTVTRIPPISVTKTPA